MLTLGIYARGYMTGTPADPATGRLYTQREYRDLMVDLAADLRARSPHLVQVGNMVENGYRYWRAEAASRPLVASSPSAQMEDFLRGAGDRPDAWPSVEEWQEDVAVVTDMESADKVGLFTTKVWSGASAAVAAQWQAYSMATFLMGADGHSFFAFTRSRDRAGASQTNAAYEMPDDLGRPTGAMRRPALRCLGARLRRRPGAGEPDRLPGLGDRGPGGHPARRLRGAGGREPRAGRPLRRGPAVRRRGPAGRGPAGRGPARPRTRPAEDPPAEDPPAEDPPAEDPPAEDPPAEEAPAPSFDLDVVSSRPAGGRVRPGRWSRIRVVLANRGDASAPRGVLRAGGRGVQGRRRAVPALSAGRAARVRVAVRAKRTGPRVLVVRLAYVAGGQRVVERVRIRVARR